MSGYGTTSDARKRLAESQRPESSELDLLRAKIARVESLAEDLYRSTLENPRLSQSVRLERLGCVAEFRAALKDGNQ